MMAHAMFTRGVPVGLALLVLPGVLAGQAARGGSQEGWFPSTFVVQPQVGARSGVDIGTGPLVARREPPTGSGRSSPEADVAFGYRIPVYRFSDGGSGRPGLDLGLEAGVLARFALGEGLNGLINSDFRVAFPLGVDLGDWEAQLSLVHVSSHVGDDYIERTPGFDPHASSRNGAEADLMYRVGPGLRLSVGSDYNWAAAGVETVRARLGAEYDPVGRDGRRVRPIGTLELEVSDYTTGLGATGMAGVGIRTGSGDLRFGLIGHTGPSQMGQFRGVDEEYVGVFLIVVPGNVTQSGSGAG
ncbi:MAG: DUF1207 domain-containing protein [Gemmatimonadota bacterium]